MTENASPNPKPLSQGEIDRVLALARGFIENGVPVFVAQRNPSGKPEFHFPKGWQTLKPDMATLDNWKPDAAVCAVTGVQFDVIDVDPRNGGDESLAAMRGAKLLPPIYGEIVTPSGGVHLYVARTGYRKGSPLKGIDLQAGDRDGNGRGFVYIPPTMRFSKVTGKPALYSDAVPPDVQACIAGAEHPDREMFLRMLEVKMPQRETAPPAEPFQPRPLTSREQRYLQATMQGISDRVASAKPGYRNEELNRCAYKVGQLIAGCGMPEQWARAALLAAAKSVGLTEREAGYTIRRSIEQGKQRPIAPGPFAPNVKAPNGPMTDHELEAYLANYDQLLPRGDT